MRRSLKILLGGLAIAASSVQAQAQQYWPNPYFQYPAPVMAPMGQATVNYRAVQPVVVQPPVVAPRPAAPQAVAQPKPFVPATVQPIRHQQTEVAPLTPPVASLTAVPPTNVPTDVHLPIGNAAEPLAPAAPAAAPAAAPTTNAASTTAPIVDFNDGYGGADSWAVAVGAGIDIVKPHWKTNPAFATFSFLNVAGVDTTRIQQTDFDYDASVAPFIWVVIQSPSGFGLRTRGWWFEDSQDLSTSATDSSVFGSAAPLGVGITEFVAVNEGDRLDVSSSLRVRTFDLEGTYGFLRDSRRLLISAGARYAYLSQSCSLALTPENPDDFSVVIDSGHNFSGAGPTLALEGSYGLGNSGFSLIGGTRGSLLFGKARQAVFGFSSGLSDGGEGGIEIEAIEAFQENNDLLPVWDLELGGAYSRDFGNVNFFFQASFVAQVWFGAGNAANNDVITVVVDPEVSDKNANLGFYGLRLTGGFRY